MRGRYEAGRRPSLRAERERMEEKEVDLGRDIFGEDDVVEPLLVVSDRDAQPSVRLEARRVQVEALHASPIETETFKKHTWWPGLFFRTLRMERVYLDGYARLHKNLVYIGYFVMLITSFLVPAQNGIEEVLTRRLLRDCEDPEGLCELYRSLSPAAVFWSSVKEYMVLFFPIMAGLTILWSLLHWFVHRSERVKEKTWAMIVVFAAYLIWTWFPLFSLTHRSPLFSLAQNDQKLEPAWSYLVFTLFLLVIPSFMFFSGSPSFVLCMLLCSVIMICYGVMYYIACLELKALHGPESSQFQTYRVEFIRYLHLLAILVLVSLSGAFRIDIASRKQFLQRLIMGDQQQEIIKQKTQNTKLQKRLLNNMLPESIVEQLRLQNFTIQSWDQLRRMSRRHFGVCIMFAELDGFTAFSAQVRPSLVMEYLNDLFLIFDGLCDDYDVYKVETVGDQYVAAVGVVTGEMHNEEVGDKQADDWILCENDGKSPSMKLKDASMFNTKQMIGFAKAIVDGSRRVGMPEGADVCPRLRVGIHTGTCMSGIVGTRNFRFCLFGDTMNTAARMEQKSAAECIHTTQDVVDLVPDECWEKLKKIEVKGKGLMQTYLLQFRGKAVFEDADNAVDPSLFISKFEYDNPLLWGKDEQSRISRSSSDSGSRFISSSDLLFQHSQALPVETQIYKKHTVCLGMSFRKIQIELAYLDFCAQLHKNTVYLGYSLYVFVLATNYLYGYCQMEIWTKVCSDSALKDTCIDIYGDEGFLGWEYLSDGDKSNETGASEILKSLSAKDKYRVLIEFSAFKMIPECAGIILGLVVLGCILHWIIHRSNHVKTKSWALFVAWMIYVLLLITMVLTTFILLRLDPSEQSPQSMSSEWPLSLFFTTFALSTLLVFFSGSLFGSYVLWWVLATALIYGLGVPEVIREQKLLRLENATFSPVLVTKSFVSWGSILFWFGMLFVMGSYFNDVTSRKRFLQRILMVKQQNRIIKQKTFNETMQKQFLESILPSKLIIELEMVQIAHSGQSMKRHQSLSQKHLGVSMLYADLVGFTSFSAQVDPFKVMVFLNELFQVFDGLCDDFNMHKIETVGDCYVAAVGVVTGELILCSVEESKADEAMGSFEHTKTRVSEKTTRNARDLIGFAKAMIRGSRLVVKPDVNTPATLRIGVHTVSPYSHFLFFASGEGNPLTFASLLRIHTGLLHQRCHWHKEPEVLLAWR